MGTGNKRQAESPPCSEDACSSQGSIENGDCSSASSRRCLSEAEKVRLLDQAVKDISEADFVAIDLEFTGLFPQSSSVKRPLCLASYFERCVQGAEYFLAPQLGICAARRCPPASAGPPPGLSSSSAVRPPSPQAADSSRDEGTEEAHDCLGSGRATERDGAPSSDEASGSKWELAPYTFYAFPQQRKQGGVDTATLKWLLQNGLDFNEWIRSGFDYTRLADLQQHTREQVGSARHTRHSHSAAVNCGHTGSGNGDFSGEPKGSANGDGDAPPGGAGRSRHGEPTGDADAAVSTLPRRESSRTEQNAVRVCARAPGGLEVSGLQRLIEAIVEKEKPLVVHNGHLDLLHAFDKFIGKVPDTLAEFRSEMLRLFTGGIYDTKHMANEGKTFVLKIGDPRTTSLVSLRHHLLRSESVCLFEIAPHRRSDFDLSFQQLNCDSGPECGRSHEAGYDALLTAQIFVMELDLYAQHHSVSESLAAEVGGSDHPDDDLWTMEELRAAKKRRRRRRNKPKRQSVPVDWNTHRWYAPFRNRVGVAGVRPGYIDLAEAWEDEKPAPTMAET
ncbi:putative CAF1 family ribonuclease domain containing protein [Neospora caninum Liverpool]|uniref:CAF1 family ribonuclease domain containing protein, putative n=1 Tax=Neospora caninum (strain Liverpool) TaxID=572307 RepID=F0VPG3_NEOCL|nr:putative CAF1 family ribonuclease domain containing protein [Neospora caninum Liverpool]CBZ55609.1 putative CAF1 family ribonuclease domain containing protein [Neospora caninum Liverpool]CEL70352.1 TPA: CAF1 family ribonuclease domain containing protein, putative [Neospora caninum Liverpool]|eukprot:XP_003885637.1 putative CAF1 family ribonuclease domain containing protein [Neospora caninum Liverpool]